MSTLAQTDADARQYDDTTDGIDWDEIIATTQDDFLAGRFAFNSADFPTHEEAMAAMWTLIVSIVEEAEREIAAERTLGAASR